MYIVQVQLPRGNNAHYSRYIHRVNMLMNEHIVY